VVDPGQRQAIIASYEAQFNEMVASRDMVLSMSGCPPAPPPPACPPPSGGGDPVPPVDKCTAAYSTATDMEANGLGTGVIHQYLNGIGCNPGGWTAGKAPKEIGREKPRRER
jgi:hypothetical protein